MCGICGISGFGSRADVSTVNLMVNKMYHRGPDEKDVLSLDMAVFGCARLSIQGIVDGKQPILSECGKCLLVCNGEIYNYDVLKRFLRSNGRQLRTSSDVEVILALYLLVGIEQTLLMLDGMFAFSIYDGRTKKTVIGRDRFGVKPIFYAQKQGQLLFASEIKSLKVAQCAEMKISFEAVAIFLALGYIPDPWTIYDKVFRLKPGHYLVHNSYGLKEEKYYDYDYSKKTKISKGDASRELGKLVRKAVQNQVIGEANIACLLSGGIDSTFIAGEAKACLEELTAYTICFDDNLYSEQGPAAAAATYLGIDHRIVDHTLEDFLERHIARQKDFDEPYAHWCNTAFEHVAEDIRNDGYKVVLSGDGADELFIGYPTIHAAVAAAKINLTEHSLSTRFGKFFAGRMKGGVGRLPFSYIINKFLNSLSDDNFETFFNFKQIISKKMSDQLLTPEAKRKTSSYSGMAAFEQHFSEAKKLDFVDALLYLDKKVFLPGSIFHGSDNAFMRKSVELRVPFMDNNLVDFSCSLPNSVKFSFFSPKSLLKHSLKKNSKFGVEFDWKSHKKRGFEVPGNSWMKEEKFYRFVSKILSKNTIQDVGFFEWPVLNSLISDHREGRANNERILQAVMSLHLFLMEEKW